MVLRSSPASPFGRKVRIAIALLGFDGETRVEPADPTNVSDTLRLQNPLGKIPVLLAEDGTTYYDSRVIIEYLDERFPHPPLMPVDPVTRAQFRLALYRIERDWYSLARQIDQEPDKKQTVKLKKILRDTILQSTDLFKVKPYFLSDEFSLVDATIAPVLWRLPYYEIELGPQAQAIEKYAQLVFSRAAFREGLSEREQEMRL